MSGESPPGERQPDDEPRYATDYFIAEVRDVLRTAESLSEKNQHRVQIDIDRFYRGILDGDFDFTREDARDLVVHYPAITRIMSTSDVEDKRELQRYLYKHGRPGYWDFSELSHVERQILRLERAGLEAFRGGDGGEYPPHPDDDQPEESADSRVDGGEDADFGDI